MSKTSSTSDRFLPTTAANRLFTHIIWRSLLLGIVGIAIVVAVPLIIMMVPALSAMVELAIIGAGLLIIISGIAWVAYTARKLKKVTHLASCEPELLQPQLNQAVKALSPGVFTHSTSAAADFSSCYAHAIPVVPLITASTSTATDAEAEVVEMPSAQPQLNSTAFKQRGVTHRLDNLDAMEAEIFTKMDYRIRAVELINFFQNRLTILPGDLDGLADIHIKHKSSMIIDKDIIAKFSMALLVMQQQEFLYLRADKNSLIISRFDKDYYGYARINDKQALIHPQLHQVASLANILQAFVGSLLQQQPKILMSFMLLSHDQQDEFELKLQQLKTHPSAAIQTIIANENFSNKKLAQTEMARQLVQYANSVENEIDTDWKVFFDNYLKDFERLYTKLDLWHFMLLQRYVVYPNLVWRWLCWAIRDWQIGIALGLIAHLATAILEQNLGINSQTPLHLASALGQVEVVTALINKISAAAINSIDIDGNTPLHLAMKNKQFAIVRLLLEQGADTTIENLRCHLPLNMVNPTECPADILKTLGHLKSSLSTSSSLFSAHPTPMPPPSARQGLSQCQTKFQSKFS